MGDVFPELKKNQAKIKEIISEEETSFSRTLVKVIEYCMLITSGFYVVYFQILWAVVGNAWNTCINFLQLCILCWNSDQGIEKFKKAAAEVNDGVLGAQVYISFNLLVAYLWDGAVTLRQVLTI